MPKPGGPKEQSENMQTIIHWVYEYLVSEGGQAPGNFLRVGDVLGAGTLSDILDKLDGVLTELGDHSTEPTQLDVLAELEEIRLSLDGGATEVTLAAVLAMLTLMKAVLDKIEQDIPDVPEHSFVSDEGETGPSVTPAGITIEVDFYQIARVRRIYVRQILGNSQFYTVRLDRRDPTSVDYDDRDIIYFDDKYHTSKKWDDIIYEYGVSFQSPTNEDKIWLTIIPSAGTSNQFIWLIDGFKLVI